jgi:endoglucanase
MRRLVAVLAVLVLCTCGHAPGPSLDRGLWETYRGAYISDDGRVIDSGQLGISHSEGQGYAMILAEAADDRATFDRVWTWTRRNLQIREDTLLAWKWDPETGSVVDINNATDADLLVAWALLRAARRWDAPAYKSEAWSILDDIRSRLVVETSIGPILLPGAAGFVHDGVVTVNPSYWVFPALSEIEQQQPGGPWGAIRISGLTLLDRARFGKQALPADWVVMTDPPSPSPLFPPRFGYEALRIPLYTCWDGLSRHPTMISLAAFWSNNPNPPAWVNLDDGSQASMNLRPGAMAIRRLLLTNGSRVANRRYAAAPGNDYYDSTLLLLASIAADENSC